MRSVRSFFAIAASAVQDQIVANVFQSCRRKRSANVRLTINRPESQVSNSKRVNRPSLLVRGSTESVFDTRGRTRIGGFYGNQQKEPLHISIPNGNSLPIPSHPTLKCLDRRFHNTNELSDSAVWSKAVLVVRQRVIPDITGKTVQASSTCRSIS